LFLYIQLKITNFDELDTLIKEVNHRKDQWEVIKKWKDEKLRCTEEGICQEPEIDKATAAESRNTIRATLSAAKPSVSVSIDKPRHSKSKSKAAILAVVPPEVVENNGADWDSDYQDALPATSDEDEEKAEIEELLGPTQELSDVEKYEEEE